MYAISMGRLRGDVLPKVASNDVSTETTWVKLIDQSKCIGCHACSVACKSENSVPLGVNRTYVKAVDVGIFPQVRRNFQVTRCNQCLNPPCVAICPTGAMFQRPDGIVDFDKSICIGCKACMAACPYDAIFINPDDHTAEKCNFCAHRIDVGLEPACVSVCPTEAILIGNIKNPADKVSAIIHREPVKVRRGEKSTRPKLFYKGAHEATLDPLAASRPKGDVFMWSQMNQDSHLINSGHDFGDKTNHSVHAKLAYDVSHSVPWGIRVSAYTWTKGIATGTTMGLCLAIVANKIPSGSHGSVLLAPLIALAALAITGLLLIADLKKPGRFIFLFTKARFESWLVRGGILLGIDGALTLAWLLQGEVGSSSAIKGIIGGLLFLASAMTATYTAFLFAQARARDLWQSPLRLPHLLVQSLLVGFAVLALVDGGQNEGFLLRTGAALVAIHLVLVLGEVTMAHPTSHAKAAVWTMTKGKFRLPFWIGMTLTALGVLAPIGGVALLVVAAIGVLGYEHAYIQAGQSVPLA